MQSRLIKCCCILIASVISTTMLAANNNVLHFKADKVQIDYKHRITTYTGHVLVHDQNSQLTGTRLITHRNKQSKINLITVFGNPAHYIDHSNPQKAPMNAFAQIIHYYPLKHLTILRNKLKTLAPAKIVQGTTYLIGKTIKIQKDASGKLKTIIALGNLAYYHTLSDPQKPPFDGQAKTIRYFPNQHIIFFLEQAFTRRGTTFVQGDKIIFNTLKNTMMANSTGSKKVHIAIDNPDLSK